MNIEPLVPPRNNSLQYDKPHSHKDLMSIDHSNADYMGDSISKDVTLNLANMVTIDEKLTTLGD